MFRFLSLLFCFGFITLLVYHCDGARTLKVVTSFSILQDLTQQIAGPEIQVNTIVGPNSDAHVFQPTPETQKLLSGADLVIINGLGFEGWITRLIDASGFKGSITVASQGIKKRYVLDEKVFDPHAWHSIAAVKIYVRNIARALCTLDPTNKDAYQQRLNCYLTKLNELDAWVSHSINTIPAQKRKIVTAHDAFQYYGKEYKLIFLAPQGVSTESEPSAAQVARLITQIKEEGIDALFIENMASARLVEQMAAETNIRILGPLYSDALSEKTGPAATYFKMMRHNTEQLLGAMQGIY
ncbi:MAG: metal ABC transporter substrate-binding protein [Pseudomonadota bacterium]